MGRKPSIRQLRKMADWTQQRAARLSKLHRSILSQIETGDIPPTDPRAQRVRRVLLRAVEKRAGRLGTLTQPSQNTQSVEGLA